MFWQHESFADARPWFVVNPSTVAKEDEREEKERERETTAKRECVCARERKRENWAVHVREGLREDRESLTENETGGRFTRSDS